MTEEVEINECCYSCIHGRHEWGYGDENWFECIKGKECDRDVATAFYNICEEYEED